MCGQCDKKKQGDIHAYTKTLLALRRLQKGGYPFEKDDLADHEWMHLGLVNELVDLMESRRGIRLS